MARDRNFQRKQKDARMPARDSHGEDRMAARQGERPFFRHFKEPQAGGAGADGNLWIRYICRLRKQ